MADNSTDKPTSDGNSAAKEPTQPGGVNLADEASKGAAAPADPANPPSSGPPRYTSYEQLPEEIKALAKAEISRAVNGALEAERAKPPRGGSNVKEQPESGVQPLDLDAQIARKFFELEEKRQAARAAYTHSLTEIGITPGSEQEAKMSSTYGELRKQGFVTPSLLTSVEGLRFLARQAGVLPTDRKPTLGDGSTSAYAQHFDAAGKYIDKPTEPGKESPEQLIARRMQGIPGVT